MAVPSVFNMGVQSLSHAFESLAWKYDHEHESLHVEERHFESEQDAIAFLSSLKAGKVCLVFGEYDLVEHLLALAASRTAKLGRAVLFQSDFFGATTTAEFILKEEYGVPVVPRWDIALRLNESEKRKIARARDDFERLEFELNVVSGTNLSEDSVDLETCLHRRFENSKAKEMTCFVSTLRDFMSSRKSGSCLEYSSLKEAIFSFSSLAKTYGFSLIMGVYMELDGTGFNQEYSCGLAERFYMDSEPKLVDDIIKIMQPRKNIR